MQQLLSHSSTQALLTPYLNTIGIAQQMGKEFMLFETNTASCGGFPGVSDAFASALFMVDFSLQMVTQNIAGAHLHMGGQNASYNVSCLAAFSPLSPHADRLFFAQPFTR